VKKTFLSFILLALGACPAGAATVAKSYSYFTVRGTTYDQIQDELAKRGPHVSSTGTRHPGATRMAFTTKIGYAQERSYCQIVSATTTVKVEVILPRWRPRRKADSDVRLFWDTLFADIKRHEEQHVDIAKAHARQIEQALKASGRQKNCEIAAAKAKDITGTVLAKHDKAQAQFDRVETINFESRILRLLRYRIERSQEKRLPG
jgi:predicted secreted Zn-dependent protease